MKQYEFPVPEVLKHFDATMQFQPFESIYSPDFEKPALETSRALAPVRMLPDKVQDALRAIRYRFFSGLTFYDYDMVWKHILKVERDGGIPAFPGAFVDWDNTARYVKRARIFKGASPERFAHWFRQLVEVTARRPDPEQMIFLNAWNEWAESTYLEPDERYGTRSTSKRCATRSRRRTALPGRSPRAWPPTDGTAPHDGIPDHGCDEGDPSRQPRPGRGAERRRRRGAAGRRPAAGGLHEPLGRRRVLRDAFRSPSPPARRRRAVFEVGEAALWPDGNAFCLFFGPTPASHGDEPRMASPGIALGRIVSGVSVLESLGATIRVSLRAEPRRAARGDGVE